MGLSINVGEALDQAQKRGVDPRVEVRFGSLTRERAGLTSEEIDRKLKEKAQSDSPGASLGDLIKGMVKEVSYGMARLSLHEFVGRFKKSHLADIIAAKFANSLYSIDNDDALASNSFENGRPRFESPEENQKFEEIVLTRTVVFLEKSNLSGSETLYEFLRQQKSQWPMVEMGRLFLEEYDETGLDGKKWKTTLRQRVADKINGNIDRIAAEAYQEKFNEDNRGFLMGYMMGRVITYDPVARKTVFDGREFDKLMGYLDGIGYAVNRMNGETLYDWLYADSRQMARYVEEQRLEQTRFGVRDEIAKTRVLEDVKERAGSEKAIFDNNFDVKGFHDRYIKPAIYKFYSNKLDKLLKIRETDILYKLNDPENLGHQNHTVQMRRYIHALVNTAKASPKNFMMKVRELFGLNNSPLMKSLSNKEVEAYFAYCFQMAEDKYRATLSEALAYREDAAVTEACVYPEKILKCRDLAKLLEWFVSPGAFKAEYPEYKDWPNDQIAFACTAFIRDFLKVSKTVSNKHFQEATKRRDTVQKFMTKTLNIKYEKMIDLAFRLLEEVDAENKLIKGAPYTAVYDAGNIGEFVDDSDKEKMKEVFQTDQEIVEYEGRRYRVSPVEHKIFQKVTMDIPAMQINDEGVFGKRHSSRASALIYTGDSHYVHVKGKIERLNSRERGKEVTDENRWMFAFATNGGIAAFRNFIYSTHARNLIKADDPTEGRNLSIKQKTGSRTKASAKFKAKQALAITKVFSFPELVPDAKEGDAKLQMVDTMLETQAQGLKEMLCYNLSMYSATGHDSYKAERAWPLLFSLYFPPEYFGDKYKSFQSQGFRGKATE